jgi:hypothetical protein
MKRFACIALSIIVFGSIALSQLDVKTEMVNNHKKYYSALTAGDTLSTILALPAGTSCKYTLQTSGGCVVGILVGSPVASDTITLKDSYSTVAQIILPATGLSPQYYPINARFDSTIIYSQKKASGSTLIWRNKY